ncbi:unnamed protein product [Xylocopa violacea]|uniref:Odorant receptor n=1 Tax=Xylocopa violacea TaxID=135666 RepID=A0ABP1NAA7_XYLVO
MNDNYQNDVQNALKYFRMLLKIVGIWPLINGYTSLFERIVSMILMIACPTSISFVLLPSGYYCFFHVKDITVTVQMLAPMCYCVACLAKFFYLCLRTSVLKPCVEQIENDWRSIESDEHRNLMTGKVLLAHKSTLVYMVLFYFVGMSYCTFLPLLSDPFQISENVTVKPLIHPGLDLFIDVYASPTYELIYFMHCVYAFLSVSIEITLCSVMASLVAHSCGMLRIQITRLKSLFEEARDMGNGTENLLAAVVTGHVDALNYTRNVSKALQEICFLQVAMTTILICANEYLCIVAWRNRDVIAIVTYVCTWITMTFNMFVICYGGELLVAEGEKFGDATYNIEWYNLRGKKSMDLMLLIGSSKFAPKLTAGKIFELSMNTFSTVIRTSFVYLNLCQAVTEW